MSPMAFLRRAWLAATGRVVVRRGACRMCGSCCRELVLRDHGHWIRSERQFAELLDENPEYGRMRITGRSGGLLTFACSWLENGRCRDYEKRLAVCRDYPGPDLYLQGRGPGAHCGFRLEAARPFGPVLRRQQRRQQERS